LARPSPWGTFTSYSLPASWRTPSWVNQLACFKGATNGLMRCESLPERSRRALMRELWNLYGKAVEAIQSFLDVDDVAAIPDALDG
jgi:hypothetical protein